jgi:redox-sensitive bicupin YhaK (pirin superfamily)
LYQARHSEQFARQGGPWEMVQLWVNLPARAKSRAPSQQHLSKTQIPVRALPDESGMIRVIAGQYQEQPGAAHHHSPLLLWDIQIKAGHQACFQVPEGWNSSLLVLSGAVRVNQQTLARPSQVVLLEQEGQHIALEAHNDTRLLLLGGEPINEPVQAYGPFVMNTQQEITQALADFDQGRFGCLE